MGFILSCHGVRAAGGADAGTWRSRACGSGAVAVGSQVACHCARVSQNALDSVLRYECGLGPVVGIFRGFEALQQQPGKAECSQGQDEQGNEHLEKADASLEFSGFDRQHQQASTSVVTLPRKDTEMRRPCGRSAWQTVKVAAPPCIPPRERKVSAPAEPTRVTVTSSRGA